MDRKIALCNITVQPSLLNNVDIQRIISDNYTLHQNLMRVWGENRSEYPYRVLYRREVGKDDTVNLLIQAPKIAAWEAIFNERNTGIVIRKKEININPKVGDKFLFRLHANPTKVRRKPNSEERQRIGIIEPAEQIEWLQRKGENHTVDIGMGDPVPTGGFKILQVVANRKSPEITVQTKTKNSLIHNAVTFDGVLEVTAQENFLNSIGLGIGSAKAFGFGLLSIGRV